MNVQSLNNEHCSVHPVQQAEECQCTAFEKTWITRELGREVAWLTVYVCASSSPANLWRNKNRTKKTEADSCNVRVSPGRGGNWLCTGAYDVVGFCQPTSILD